MITAYAYNLKAGTRFTYVGAFAEYHADSDAEPDETYLGKVKLRGVRHSPDRIVYLDIRLDSAQEIEVLE